MESGAVLPLGLLNADQTRHRLVFHDAMVSGSHHYYGKPTLDIPTFPGVGLTRIYGGAAGQKLQCGLHLCTHHAMDRDEKRGKVAPLLQIEVKVIKLLFPFCHH